jgi:hypothetical protein
MEWCRRTAGGTRTSTPDSSADLAEGHNAPGVSARRTSAVRGLKHGRRPGMQYLISVIHDTAEAAYLTRRRDQLG